MTHVYSTAKPVLTAMGIAVTPLSGKIPVISDWINTPSPDGYGGANCGIICGVAPNSIHGVDIDVTNEYVANEIRDYIMRNYGVTMYRVGKAPKVLLVYRLDRPGVRKKTSAKYDIGRVEILGAGQQFAAFGRHPVTKAPYEWPGPLGSLLDVSVEQIPMLTESDLVQIISDADKLIQANGYDPIKKDPPATSSVAGAYDPTNPLDRPEKVNLTLADCEKILSTVDSDCDRDQWRNIGMSLHFEFDGSAEALSLWNAWSAKGKKFKDGEPEKQWESFGRYTGRPISGAYLKKLRSTESSSDIWGDPDFFRSLNWSVSRFVDDPPDMPMVIYNMLPKGIVSLFYSSGGAGKSTLVLAMAVKIALAAMPEAQAIDFFGNPINGGKVVIITAEDPEGVINKRYIKIVQSVAGELQIPVDRARDFLSANMLIGSTFGHAVQLFRVKNDGLLLTTAYYTSLIDFLKSVPDCQLVIIDTKTRFSPGEGLGNVTATQEITHYEAIAQATGASVMLLHHTGKKARDGSQDGQQAYRDATALFDSVRAAWYLRALRPDELQAQDIPEEEGNKYLYLENSKNNYIQLHQPLLIHRDGFAYTKVAMKPKASAAERKEQRVEADVAFIISRLQLASGAVWGTKDVLLICKGKSWTRIRKAIDAAVEIELIDQFRDGKKWMYQLTEAGRSYNLDIE